MLDSEIRKNEEKLEILFNEQDKVTDEISSLNKKIEDSKTEVQELREKIAEITEWSTTEKGVPEVRVHDIIFADTAINGIYSSLTLKQSRKSVLIKENMIQDFDDRSEGNSDRDKYGSNISIRPL